MKRGYILTLMLLLAACAGMGQTEPEASAPTPAGAYDFSGVHLRLRNEGAHDLANVTLSVGGQTEEIGALPAAAASETVTFSAVQPPPAIRATSGETVYEWTAEAEAAEGLIPGGEFTLELALENGELQAHFLMENPILQDAQFYADDMGISLEEALARLEVQDDDEIGILQNRLHAEEADTFAGLWVEHEPQYRVVVAFTRDGQETIGKYVTPDSELAELIEVRPAQYTYAQLQADQDAVLRILEDAGLPAGAGIMVMENRVVVDISDQATFDKAIAEANAPLPESVIVNSVYEAVGEDPPFSITPVPGVFMPQLKLRDVAFMEALLIGELVVEDGCLRVRGENESHLVIWQADYFLTDNDGVLEILDETGEGVARVGETIYLGGGEQGVVDDAELRQPIPEACGGPYWRMGKFLPEEYIPNVAPDSAADPTPVAQADDGWEVATLPETGLAVAHPADWFVHNAGKMVEITPNAQPTWSSFFDPDQPHGSSGGTAWHSSGMHGGPVFLVMHNLNRQMAATPLAEVEAIVTGYEAEIEAIEPAAPIPEWPDVVSGVYRLADDEEAVLLVGAAVNPLPESPQPVVAMTAVVKTEDLAEVQPIFERVLQSLQGI